MLRKVLIALAVLVVLFLVVPGTAFTVHAQGTAPIQSGPDLPMLTQIGIGLVFLLYIISHEIAVYRRDTKHFDLLSSLVEAVQSGIDNQTTLTAVQELAKSIPPGAITDMIAALTAARVIVPTFGPLDDQFRKLLPYQQGSGQPPNYTGPGSGAPPNAATFATATAGEAGSAANPPPGFSAQIPQQ